MKRKRERIERATERKTKKREERDREVKRKRERIESCLKLKRRTFRDWGAEGKMCLRNK